MASTRTQLDALLAALDKTMPEMIKQNRNGEFWAAFAGEGDAISNDAAAEDQEYVDRRLDEILVAHGMKVPDDESPPDG